MSLIQIPLVLHKFKIHIFGLTQYQKANKKQRFLFIINVQLLLLGAVPYLI